MSNTQFIFLRRSAVPDRTQLQAALDDLHLPVKLDAEFTPFTDMGFSPCSLPGGVDAGFEIFYEEAGEILADATELADEAGDRDVCISLVWRSSDADLACVMAVSAAYAKKFGALVSYELEESSVPHSLLKEARELLSQLETSKPLEPNPAVPIHHTPKVEITVTGLVRGKVVTRKFKPGDRT